MHSTPLSFTFDLSSIHEITDPLGIPWLPISHKGHDFQTSFSYVGFKWDEDAHTVSLSNEKCTCLLAKVTALITPPVPQVNKRLMASIHGSLQHITLVYHQGCS